MSSLEPLSWERYNGANDPTCWAITKEWQPVKIFIRCANIVKLLYSDDLRFILQLLLVHSKKKKKKKFANEFLAAHMVAIHLTLQ